MYFENSIPKIEYNFGMILYFTYSNSTINRSVFKNNTGSVVLSYKSKIVVATSDFVNNTDAESILVYQGTILGSKDGTLVINNSNFTNNNSPVVVALSSRIELYNSLLIVNNSAEMLLLL